MVQRIHPDQKLWLFWRSFEGWLCQLNNTVDEILLAVCTWSVHDDFYSVCKCGITLNLFGFHPNVLDLLNGLVVVLLSSGSLPKSEKEEKVTVTTASVHS